MMKKSMVLARCGLILGSVFYASTLFSQESSTTWKGTLNAGGTQLRLEIDVSENNGKYSGELRSLDQGNIKAKTTEIKNDDVNLNFLIPRFGAKFNGKYTSDRKSVKGTFSQNGKSIPLTLTRVDSKDDSKPKPTESLKEAWVGKLNLGVIKPVMQFRIVKLNSGETKAYFDSVTEGLKGFPATFTSDGKTLKFNVARIKLSFEGKLNETVDQAKGTWSQGGRNIPLTLKKQANEYDSVNVWDNRPQKPVGPFPYDSEEVKFENTVDDLTLAGTLTIPKKPGRHPAVVLISGSGPRIVTSP